MTSRGNIALRGVKFTSAIEEWKVVATVGTIDNERMMNRNENERLEIQLLEDENNE